MTYTEFLNSLVYGINMFYQGLVYIANVLISNYIIITLLGLSLFSTLIYFFCNNILTIPFIHKNKNLDNVRSDK